MLPHSRERRQQSAVPQSSQYELSDRPGPGSELGSSCCTAAPLASTCCFSSLLPPFPSRFLVPIVFLLAHKADKIRRRFSRAQNRFLAKCQVPTQPLLSSLGSPEDLGSAVGAEEALISLLRAVLQLRVHLVSRSSVPPQAVPAEVGFPAPRSGITDAFSSPAKGAECSWLQSSA